VAIWLLNNACFIGGGKGTVTISSAIVKSNSKNISSIFFLFYRGQPRTLLQLKLVGELTINLFLT
jgi:hypothetical protein